MQRRLAKMAADDDAYFKQAQDARNAKQSQEVLQGGEQPQPSFVSKFMTSIGRASTNTLDWAVQSADSINVMRAHAAHDIGAGVVTAVANTGDAIGSAATSSGKGLAMAEDPEHADDAKEGSLPTSPIWDHAKGAILDFRDAVAVKDPTLADNLLQSGAQLAVPFAGYSRALAGVHGFAKIAAAGAITDATALGPHDPRMADLIALGRHVEGKLGDTLRALAPDGSAVNAYINYLGDRANETEAEGRFKNVLDGFGANAILTPLLHAAASGLKWGTAGLRYAVGKGVGAASDMVPPKSAVVEGYQPQNMNLSPEERAAERERIAAKRDAEEGVRQEVVPEPIPRRAAETEGEAVRRDRDDPNAVAAMAATGPLNSLDRSAEHASALADLRTHLAEVHATGEDKPVTPTLAKLAGNIDWTASPDNVRYKAIFNRLSQLGIPSKFTTSTVGEHSNMKNVYGSYDPKADTIAIHSAAMQGDDTLLMHTIAHEATHAATLRALKDPTNAFLVKGISRLMPEAEASKAVQALSEQDRYAFKDGKPSEFVAEAFSNPRLQQALKAEGLWPEVQDYLERLLKPTAGAAAGAAAIDWDDPDFKKFFSDILTARTPPSA